MEKSKLTAYALNELSEEEMKLVEEYLKTHPEEKIEIEEIKMLGQILKSEFSQDLKIEVPPFKEKMSFSKLRDYFKIKYLVGATSLALIMTTSLIVYKEMNPSRSSMKVIDIYEPQKTESAVPSHNAEKNVLIQVQQAEVQIAKSSARRANPKPSIRMLVKKGGQYPSVGSPGLSAGERRLAGRYGRSGGVGLEHSFSDHTNSEKYAKINENSFIKVLDEPLSTFSIDVDTASYSNARRILKDYNQIPPQDAIRTEEFVNYFDYDYQAPQGAHPIAINMEATVSPWNKDKVLVKVGLKAKEIAPSQRPSSNLVFLVDVSGSMADDNKLPLVRSSLRTLVTQMKDHDKISLITYAGSAGVVLDSISAEHKTQILSAINNLSANGGTNGEAGIRKAYEIAQKNLINGGNNRVLIVTDGDFNIGTKSSDELLDIIRKKSKDEIYLTVLGFGMGNYNDDLLEKIADEGRGNYFYIDSEKESEKVFITQLAGTLYTLAKDVKIQIEFNPNVVSSYRLVGYENRMLKKEDFNNDKVDAGELGAGHSVTALYELVMKGKEKNMPAVDELKYQKKDKPSVIEEKKMTAVEMTEMLTAKFRYKLPESKTSVVFEQVLSHSIKPIEGATCSTRFAAAVASFSQWMRGSENVKDVDSAKILKLAQGCLATNNQKDASKEEFVELVKKAQKIKKEK